ncbi:VOC family protein [Tenacibaculum xiamenense]|uniref:VOC family protein n=1 Tax=Tenacibaculum xiamenense TaxID=1261553 RepID=UPI003893CDDE
MKIDHVLLRVDNLENTMNDFKDLGFRVYPGNSKKNCHHAMIYFKDGSFLELIDQSMFPRVFRFLARIKILNLFGIIFKRFAHYCISKERFLDLAVLSDDIDSFHKLSEKKSKLIKMTRKNHLNQIVNWKLFAFDKMHLPFVMSEYKPNRFPENDAYIHKNGVLGIKQIDIDVKDSKAYIEEYNTYFKTKFLNIENFTIGNTTILLNNSKKYGLKSITLSTNKTLIDIDNKLSHYGILLAENINSKNVISELITTP